MKQNHRTTIILSF